MITTPLVTLQKPKDISLSEIEEELSQIWHSQNGSTGSPVAIRASTFSMVVYEPQEFQQLLAVLGFYQGEIEGIHGPDTRAAIEAAQKQYGLRITGQFNPETLDRLRQEVANVPPEKFKLKNLDQRGYSVSDAIAIQNPCRIITLAPTLGEDLGVTAQVSAYCPIQRNTGSGLICCEYITLRGTKSALNRVGDMVSSLMIPDLPKFVWWKATPNVDQELFKTLASHSNCIIFDSSYFSDPESELLKMQSLMEADTYLADLNWHRISAWQELTAAAFDPPERRASLPQIDQVAIDYEKGNTAQALMFLGWLASRLGWEPDQFEQKLGEAGDYDITNVRFRGPEDRTITAELAGAPIANFGEIAGDLIGIRLTSTNLNANCCTILCSETTGCMRMEAGGSAQACRTEQVTAVNDQKAEFLLSQQLQRWGRDVLYEETLAMTAKTLQLRA